MSIDNPRRLLLRVVVKLMGGALVLALLAAMLSPLLPDLDRPLSWRKVAIAPQKPGELRQLEIDGQPLLLMRRNETQMSALQQANPALLSPLEESSEAKASEWLLVRAHGTALGCPLEYVADSPEAPQPWRGGFHEACAGVWYDLAGRVYASPRAVRDLITPPFRIEGETTLLLGSRE